MNIRISDDDGDVQGDVGVVIKDTNGPLHLGHGTSTPTPRW
ncbi:hypothetical protein [Nonomuraea basaltis]|nr:hypothetical protein [Nonomuraea basaltis]